MKLETLAIHAGSKPDSSSGAVIPPIQLSTTFIRDQNGEYPSGFGYSRANNPNREQLETCVAALEQGAKALAFSSGMSACSSVFQSLKAGDHIIIPDDVYHGVSQLLLKVLDRWNLNYSVVDMSNLEDLKASIQKNTRLMWIETPSNPKLNIYDLEILLKLCKDRNIISVCDNTFASPILQQPILIGADLVMHSSTKYLGGHSDVLGGILVFKNEDESYLKIKDIQLLAGAVPSPFDCFLTLRGIKTLAYRMRGHCDNAKAISEFLLNHTEVESVFHPRLKNHKNHTIAAKQMAGFGGMMSVTLKKGEKAAKKLASSCELFAQATSLGGVESLIEHRASVEPEGSKTPKNLVRLSVGLEHHDDLIKDLEIALNGI